MGEPLVSAIAQTLMDNLSSASLGLIGRLWGLEDDLHKLKSTFSTLQVVLQHAEIKQSRSKPIQNWLRKLKDAAYEAEDILADMAIESCGGCLDAEGGNSFLFSSISSIPIKIQMAAKVNNIVEKVSAIAEERHNYHLGDDEGVVGYRFGVTSISRETDSWVIESEIYGRSEEKEMVMKTLLDNGHDEDDLFVYAICGMGGLGKTTLAQLVYNDERVESHFDLRIWVCVSEDFSIQRLVRAIIESIDGRRCDLPGLDPLQRSLRERLRGKKFMLVLDDVWNEDYSQWDKMRKILRCNSKGSTLVVTTRIQQIASMMGKTNVHNIGCLKKEDSWSLFKQIAFATGEVDEELVSDIGWEMVEKCRGVPLAIRTLGGLLQSKSEAREWLAVKTSKLWDALDDENGIKHILKLSYYNLLPHMRQCFAYCCVFPKDYEMEVDELIRLWMANAFIPCNGQGDLLVTARLIFKGLVSRSFFQVIQKDNTGSPITCKMHDLMHDLAASIMGHETYILEGGKELEIHQRTHHLSCHPSSLHSVLDGETELPSGRSLRSFIILRHQFIAHIEYLSSFLSTQQYLRSLDLSRCSMTKWNLVSKFKHLKYLVMSCYDMRRMPESLTHLSNLQTWKLMDSASLFELPKDLKSMKNLWFLELDNSSSLRCSPPWLGDLTCLRRLSIFIVGADTSQHIDQLKELDLEGELTIKGLDNVRDLEDAKRANLVRKKNLKSLRLYWTDDHRNKLPQYFEEVLQGIEPHRNLERIFIFGYHGSRFPKWMWHSTFTNLKEIRLEQCQGCEYLPPLGNLPSLKSLELFQIHSVWKIGNEWLGDGDCKFPALTRLIIWFMSNLEEWSILDSVNCFPRLVDIKIVGCPKLGKFPHLPTLRCLSINGCNAALLPSIRNLAALELCSLHCLDEVDVFPDVLLQNCKALRRLDISAGYLRSLHNMWANLSSLKTLVFTGCFNVGALPDDLGSLCSLESLEFSNCCDLEAFPAIILDGLSSLKSLSFSDCNNLELFPGPINRASPLINLELSGLPKLQCLPESMKQLSALKELTIVGCPGLVSLPEWFGCCLKSLVELKILDCENLSSFPDSFRSFLSLQKLEIFSCRELSKRCKKPDGDYWSYISHIPIIEIDMINVQSAD